MQAVLTRLARLERQNRNLKLAGVAAMAVLGTLVLMAQSPPQSRTVETQHLVLEDESGSVRGRWDAYREGPVLSLFDSQQRNRLQLSVTNEGGANLVFFDMNRKLVADLGTERTQASSQLHPALLLYGVPGQPPTVTLDALTMSSALHLFGPTDNLEAHLGTTDEHAFLSFGKPGPMGPSFSNVWLTSSPDGSLLNVRDVRGFSARIGNADLETPSQGGTSHTSAGSLILFNDKGNVIWQAP